MFLYAFALTQIIGAYTGEAWGDDDRFAIKRSTDSCIMEAELAKGGTHLALVQKEAASVNLIISNSAWRSLAGKNQQNIVLAIGAARYPIAAKVVENPSASPTVYALVIAVDTDGFVNAMQTQRQVRITSNETDLLDINAYGLLPTYAKLSDCWRSLADPFAR